MDDSEDASWMDRNLVSLCYIEMGSILWAILAGRSSALRSGILGLSAFIECLRLNNPYGHHSAPCATQVLILTFTY
jgi:hypothetical protein